MDMQTVGVPAQGAALLAVDGSEWLLRSGRYVLKSTLTIEEALGAVKTKTDKNLWSGQLQLPPVEITVSPEDIDYAGAIDAYSFRSPVFARFSGGDSINM
jgi:hypothetical protein